ncbi:MAG TPA: response regulator [Vicinamibacterales bacterium]|jgi:CheY-like chemotaxis protein
MRVLIADDDRLTRMLLGRILATELGCTVTDAADGVEALNALSSGQFDLLVLDLQMPVMDGFETLRAIRASADFRATPVIVLTADRSEETVRLVAGFHVLDYLTKPLNSERLLDRFGRVLKSLGAAPVAPGPAAPVNRPLIDPCATMLIVDGHAEFRAMFVETIGRSRTVMEAESGVRGLRDIVEHQPGAVFIGTDLGVLNETLLVRKLRSLPAVKGVRLVAIVSGPEARAECGDLYDASISRTLLPNVLEEELESLSRVGMSAGAAAA